MILSYQFWNHVICNRIDLLIKGILYMELSLILSIAIRLAKCDYILSVLPCIGTVVLQLMSYTFHVSYFVLLKYTLQFMQALQLK